ncbi:hypothetical protein A6P54_21950 [Bacillus sp. MKU004]|nr:hypothetical protein A6P54_21950 [Bacillus sp. MKU004]
MQVRRPRGKAALPGQNAAGSRLDPPDFGRLRDDRHRSGRKTLAQRAKSGDLEVKRQATWGMSVGTFSEVDEVDLAEAPGASDPRAYGPGAPRRWYAGVKASF